jgi:hypothetical protein
MCVRQVEEDKIEKIITELADKDTEAINELISQYEAPLPPCV